MLSAPPRRAAPRLAPEPGGGPGMPAPAGGGGLLTPEETATLTLALLTFVSSAAFLRVFYGHGWMAPVLLTVIAAHASGWWGRRRRLRWAPSALLSVAVVALLVCWTVLGPTTRYGIPGGATWSAFARSLDDARRDAQTAIAPVQAARGYVLVVTSASGLIAVLGDWLAFRLGSSLSAAVPAVALFVTGCTFGQGPGRQWLVAAEVAALVVFLAAHRIAMTVSGRAWFGQRRARLTGWVARAGGVAAAAAVVTALVVTPVLGTAEGHGVLGWRGHFGGGGAGKREVANPIVDLHTRLLDLSDTPVFTVVSTVPSYWRLTSLDDFNGQVWTSTNSYRGFATRLPGGQAVPPGTRTVTEKFSIENLNSVWLPDAFTPVSVTGRDVRGVGYDPVSGSLITSRSTSNGMSYTVESYQYLSTLDPRSLEKAPPVRATGSLARYVALPSVVPRAVYDLAREITKGKTTEYGKALALQYFFLGPTFHYSLNPPADGYGISALLTFLFGTRTGYCQQFAGAYAVLARAVGLPTRLAVGFALGEEQAPNTYQVLDADAHTWPEVYFGPKYGWLPFEPTPSFVDPPATGYLPPLPPLRTTPTTPATPDTLAPANRHRALPPGSRGATTNTTAATARILPAGNGSAAWPALALALAATVAWILLNWAARRLRWRWRIWRVRRDPAAVVLAYWAVAAELFAWWGVHRLPGETDLEFGRRAGRHIAARLIEPSPWIPRGAARLAGVAVEAAFAPSISPGRAEEAAMVTEELRQRCVRAATGRQLLSWLFVPRPGLRAPRHAAPAAHGVGAAAGTV